MRSWTHEAKNKLSEKIDNEIEKKFRTEKETRLEAEAKK
jgi:hypothetical protein